MDKRKRIALLAGQVEEEYQANFIRGFLSQAFMYNYDVCVFAMYQKCQMTPSREIGDSSIFSLVEYEQFDALVLMPDTIQTTGVAQKIEETVRKRFSGPVLVIDQESGYFPYIELDYYDSVKKLVNHLIEHHGYTEIGYVTGKKEHKHAVERLRAFRDCMAEHNLPVVEDWIYYGDFWYNGGEQAIEKFMKDGGKLPRAIAFANDYMAVGAGKMLEKYGLRVPEDVAIVGYDMVKVGTTSPKPITSAPLSTYKHGEHAAACMKALFEGKELPEFHDDVELFIGSSCGCHNESVEPKITLREHWVTDMSERAFFASNNHMNEDLLCQNTFYDLMNTLDRYIYQIGEFDSFHICLNEDWSDFEKKEKEGRQHEIYSNRMAHVVDCGADKNSRNRIYFDSYFLTSMLLPEIHEAHELPRVYFFTPLYFEERSFGYAVLCYENKAESYDSIYRMWLRNVMQELECFRRIEALQRSNQRLEASMIRDPLTGLFNYNGFLKQGEYLIRKVLREELKVGAVAFDIKELVKINEKQGRTEGDRVIIELANALNEYFPEALNICFGNGEMVAVLLSRQDAVSELQQGFLQVKEHMAAMKVELFLGIEVGEPQSIEELERLVNSAVSRKNGSKVSERKRIKSENFTEEEQKEAEIVEELLNQNRFKYHFQPIVNVKTGEIFGYEALMRPDVDPYLPPPVVLKYAGYYDRMYDVEKATFFNILAIVSNRRDIFNGTRKVFINSIPGNLLHGEDAERLELLAHDLKNTVVVEITEWLELSDQDLHNLKEYYKKIGFNTAIDDYGAGYSNVTNLLRYMPNSVKIDRMLLSNIQDSPQKQHFVKDIITFSHDNNINVIAEGVETKEELQTVIQLGADLVQGYYIARPGAEIIPTVTRQIKNEILEFSRLASLQRYKSDTERMKNE